MNTDWHDPIQRYIAGLTTDEESALLQDSLKRDDALARLYLRYMNLDVALEAHASTAEATRSLLIAAPALAMKHGLPRLSWRLLTTAAVACSLILMVWWHMQSRDILEVVAVSSEVRWASDHQLPRLVKAGENLPTGRFETLAEDSLLRLRFKDGTEVEFSGPTKAELREESEKRVFMAAGVLTAQVPPQPAGRPMRVLTPTAAIEVLGTIFTLDAALDETRLSVEEGSVRLQRLVDKQHTEVAADHGVVASLDASSPLSPVRRVRPPQQWSASFDPVRERITGSVVTAEASGFQRVAAVAKLLSDPMSEWPHVVHWRVQVAPSRKQSAALVSLSADSMVEVRWRTVQQVSVQVVLKTYRARSGFRGGFTATLDSQSPLDAGGWRTSRVPIHAFTAIKPELGGSPLGLELLALEVTTLKENAGLEIAHLGILKSGNSL